MSRSLFDPLVDDYDAARPSYPDDLYDALDRLAGTLAGADVVDVGAGTGIATRALLARGAVVTAVDLGAAMLARLVARGTPGASGRLRGAVLGDAHALPLRAATADLVCFAQAWHWVRPAEGAREVARVLRPGGALAVWWNDSAAGNQPWWQAQQAALEVANRAYARDYRREDVGAVLAETGRFASVESEAVDWVRELSVDDYLVFLRSKSYVSALGDGLPDFLARQRESLWSAFPGGVVREPFRCRLWVARTEGRLHG